jgi:hypothetical protein
MGVGTRRGVMSQRYCRLQEVKESLDHGQAQERSGWSCDEVRRRDGIGLEEATMGNGRAR